MANILNFKLGQDTFTTEHHNKDVKLAGLVDCAKPVTPELVLATFRCEYCGKLINVKQGGGRTKLLKPESCTNEACEQNRQRFTFLQSKSIFSNYQEIWLKPVEETKLRLGKGQKIILKQDLVGAAEGENVQVIGKLGFELKGRTNFAIPVVIATKVKRLD